MFQWLVTYSFLQYFLLVLVIYFSGYIFLCVGWHLFFQDAGVHALSNVCHVDVERISKRKPGEVVCTQNLLLPLSLDIRRAHILSAVMSDYDLNFYQKPHRNVLYHLNRKMFSRTAAPFLTSTCWQALPYLQLTPHEPGVVKRAVNHFLQVGFGLNEAVVLFTHGKHGVNFTVHNTHFS